MQLLLQRIQTPEQLYELLQLRQQVYKESLVSGFLSNPSADIDMDVFDHQSEFFGLYQKDSGKQRLIGGRRVVHRKLIADSSRMIEQLGYPLQKGHNAVLPIEKYGDQKSMQAVSRLQQQHGTDSVVEPSRMIIGESERGIKAIVFMLKATVVVSLGPDKSGASLFCCNEKYASLYQRVGCRLISKEAVLVGGSPVITFSMEYKDMLPKVKRAFETMHRSYIESRTIFA